MNQPFDERDSGIENRGVEPIPEPRTEEFASDGRREREAQREPQA
jgi:hypothetical protein